MRKITCNCEQTFSVEIPDTVDLDINPALIDDIASGSFLSCVCPTCGSVLHTDLMTRVDWPSRKVSITLIPEIDRLAYVSGNLKEGKGTSVVIGYAELADRVATIRAGLDPIACETIKYHLALKAQEAAAGSKTAIYFERVTDSLEIVFHIHGLKKDEVAVMTVPRSVYDSVLSDVRANPSDDTYAALLNGDYLSYQNILIEEGKA